MLNSFVANVPTTQRQTSNRIIHFIVEHYEYFNKHDPKEEKKHNSKVMYIICTSLAPFTAVRQLLCTIRLNQFFSSNWYFLNIQLCVHRIYSNVRQIRCAKVRAHAPHTYQVSNFFKDISQKCLCTELDFRMMKQTSSNRI